MDVSLTYANQLKGLLAKADGKDKFVALLQYAAMFAAAGEPGAFLAAQKSLSAARKPFRVFKPVEFLMPLVERPPKGKGLGACLAYVRVPPAEARASLENLRGWLAKKQQRGKHFSRRAFSRNGRVDARRAPRRERRATRRNHRSEKRKNQFFFLPYPHPRRRYLYLLRPPGSSPRTHTNRSRP